MIIASFAGLLGFSVAIGAFFAGLVFSRDPTLIKTKTAVSVVYDLFVPFFFISIGLKFQITSIETLFLPSLLIVTTAIVGKFIGSFIPALIFRNSKNSALLALSMIPRAEVAMIIMQRSLNLDDNSMPKEIYSAMVVTCIITCTIPPLILNRLIKKPA